jgi:hypothetical protein
MSQGAECRNDLKGNFFIGIQPHHGLVFFVLAQRLRNLCAMGIHIEPGRYKIGGAQGWEIGAEPPIRFRSPPRPLRLCGEREIS